MGAASARRGGGWGARGLGEVALQEAVHNADAQAELLEVDLSEIMCATGVDRIVGVLERAFREKRNTGVQAAMSAYDAVARQRDEGVRQYTARFRTAERVMREAGLQPYAGEARATRYLMRSYLHPGDARNVMVQAGGNWEFDKIRLALETLWPVRPPSHTSTQREHPPREERPTRRPERGRRNRCWQPGTSCRGASSRRWCGWRMRR